jgi:uncharacterized metal-binding protein
MRSLKHKRSGESFVAEQEQEEAFTCCCLGCSSCVNLSVQVAAALGEKAWLSLQCSFTAVHCSLRSLSMVVSTL